MKPPQVVLIGFIGKIPVAGMSLYNLHHIVGLVELGYDVHYVELIKHKHDCYDPSTNTMTGETHVARRYLEQVMPQYGITTDRMSLIDLDGRCHFSGWRALEQTLDNADFVLTLCDPIWFEALERCERRAYLDGDPMFTQVELLRENGDTRNALAHYPVCYSYGIRIGQSDCQIPTAGRTWLPARPVVATTLWQQTSVPRAAPMTSVLNWASSSDVTFEGVSYGHKNRSLAKLMDLPRCTKQEILLAVGGPAPKAELEKQGWHLTDPLVKTGTIENYRRFIESSCADLGIAKHAYVASRSGWFSDRSTCYLASARPVIHEDTGCGDWLPHGEGVLLFSDMDSLIAAIDEVSHNIDRHSVAARRVAEEWFEARTVLAEMLAAAGFN